LGKDESAGPIIFDYSGKTVGITIMGDTAERKITLNANGILFRVNPGVTLTLDDKITLVGRSSNTNSLVYVDVGGTLVMKDGAKISGNHYSANSQIFGGGVQVNSGVFMMSGGEISGNSVYSPNGGASTHGGGVYIHDGTFTMSGGEISRNRAQSSYGSNYGGGVYIHGGTFTMSGGKISSNSAQSYHGSTYGGGVYIGGGSFTMSGGEISGNVADYASESYGRGGGVYVGGGTFVKTSAGGIIYGDTDTTHTAGSSENTAIKGSGHAVYVSNEMKRNSTAGSSVALDSSISGSAGGWE
jgi:hypothetical protein